MSADTLLRKIVLPLMVIVMVAGGATLAIAGGYGSDHGSASGSQYHPHDPCQPHHYTASAEGVGGTSLVALFVHGTPSKPKCPPCPDDDYHHWSSFTGGSYHPPSDGCEEPCRSAYFTTGSYGGHDDDCDDDCDYRRTTYGSGKDSCGTCSSSGKKLIEEAKKLSEEAAKKTAAAKKKSEEAAKALKYRRYYEAKTLAAEAAKLYDEAAKKSAAAKKKEEEAKKKGCRMTSSSAGFAPTATAA